MRLKTIKLAGFKSFVDPTTVNLASNMCAVVGPNGCGKSNIIDAVRWVMGESSAKNLRGEAMTDVIFNGSGSRKPVGQASIELVFDNSDGTITGEYAGYNEISVKRRVTRDGQNLYYLNNSRCRRRDITDIFLGTGLGPRSYAIIEQGMISRLIEAKPEELRVYIEEAAGISRYKERRKETESRMRRTMENLERLTDIREELERQLVRLERQAKAAEKYGQYKSDERKYSARLRTLRYLALQTASQTLRGNITQYELDVEEAVTQRVKFDTEIEKQRAEYTGRSDAFNEIQRDYYSLGADIARIEQSIQHAKEREQRLRIDIEQNQRDLQEAREHLQLDESRIEGWQAELLEMDPELETLKSEAEASNSALNVAEQDMHQWQSEWDQFNQQAAAPRQQAEVQQSRIQYVEQVQQRLIARREQIEKEMGAMVVDVDREQLELEQAQLEELESKQEEFSALIGSKGEEVKRLREEQRSAAEQRDRKRGELQSLQARLTSLEALQKAALGRDRQENFSAWLNENNLQDRARLAEKIEVSEGWERALEVVLGDSLQALIDVDLPAVAGKLDSVPGALVAFAPATSTPDAGPESLLGKITSPVDLSAYLAKVRCVDSLESALALLATLQADESVVTREGYWLGPNWLRVAGREGSEEGVIARQQEIKNLLADIDIGEEELETLNERVQGLAEALQEAENTRESTRLQQEEQNRELLRRRAALTGEMSRIGQITEKQQRARQDLNDIAAQLSQESENLGEARVLLEEAIAAMERDSGERERLLTRRDQLRSALDSARQKARHDQDKAHEIAMRSRSVQTQTESMKLGLQRLHEQIARMEERRELLQQQLEEANEPGADQQSELETLLEKRVQVEHKLTEARRAVEDTEHALREAEQARDRSEKVLLERRDALEKARLELQSYDVRAQNIEQQLQEDEFDLQAVAAELTESDTEDFLQAELEQIGQRIARLGPINLAAIEEYSTESERKTYLDEQNADLREALETLEGAIRKIDKETRTRFKETFDQINSGLQSLFPQLFGGGHAYLELTGEDMLDTGIAIMARPPGKKNSTIHLLSGGEKALTAIALVFSIFHLNPAPFCMLDEVDAPLDDANVGRYAQMVEKMSEKVQFIYITHNKIAMERARHLMGVTMQEAGVSRMVTVDVEEAAELAAV